MRICSCVSVALLAAALCLPLSAQDPLVTLPQNYRVVLDNDSVRVIHVRYNPHEKLPVHDHPRVPTVYVYLSDSPPVRFSHDEEKEPFTIVRPAVKPGTFRVSPGRIEVHTVENLGDTPSDFLRVELKKIPLGVGTLHTPAHQTFDLTHTSSSVAFTHPRLVIERFVCMGTQPCTLAEADAPALLIALSPALLRTSGDLNSKARHLAVGDAQWCPNPERLTAAPDGNSTAHLLRLKFP